MLNLHLSLVGGDDKREWEKPLGPVYTEFDNPEPETSDFPRFAGPSPS